MPGARPPCKAAPRWRPGGGWCSTTGFQSRLRPTVILALARYFAARFHPKSVAASEFGCVKIETNRMMSRTGRDPTNWPSLSATAASGSKHVKPARLAPVFAALILTACHGPPSPPPSLAIGLPPGIGSGQGIDLPIDASDVLMELQQSRMDFVARYYREPESRWPPLSASEAQRLSSLGLKIVAVWESHSRDPTHFSYSSGYYDAMTAYQRGESDRSARRQRHLLRGRFQCARPVARRC